jgi:hypothetical protein
MTPLQRDVVDGYLISNGIELSKEERAALDAELEARQYGPGSPQQIAKRFEQNPQAYDGLLYQDPRHLDWYQQEVKRLAKIDEITQPIDHTGKRIAADAQAGQEAPGAEPLLERPGRPQQGVRATARPLHAVSER